MRTKDLLTLRETILSIMGVNINVKPVQYEPTTSVTNFIS